MSRNRDPRLTRGWTISASGRIIWPLRPRAEDYAIADIAHALAQTNRFRGACRRPYSVAEHSVLVSLLCDPADALWGLLHDAAEAYLGDVPRPLKAMPEFDSFRAIEAAAEAAVAEAFGLRLPVPESVQEADKAALYLEAHALLQLGGPGDPRWDGFEVWRPYLLRRRDAVPAAACLGVNADPVTAPKWTTARRIYLTRYDEILGRKRISGALAWELIYPCPNLPKAPAV